MTNFRFLPLIGLSLIINAASAIGLDDQGRGQRPAEWKQDATINDVFFIDENRGWAVGDQGLILRTTNGGGDWNPVQDAGLDLDDTRSLEDKLMNMRPVNQAHELYPITCSLKSVYFINEHRGWIAGNYYTPLLNRSHCVILRTQDGGRTWNSIKNSLLPEINRIHFQHVMGGWALGRSSSLHPSGILTTSSGGSNWSSQSLQPPGNFIDGDLVPTGFVVVDDQYRLAKISGRQLESAVVLDQPTQRVNAVRMSDAQRGWAVGDHGMILQTNDGGLSWSRVKFAGDQQQQLSQFDFATLHITPDRVFVAGNPGNLIFSFSSKNGDSIRAQPTGIQTPLRKLTFVDSNHGWAVGSLGTIIATADGGRNWRIQRSTHDRLSILVACQDIRDLPLAFLSRYCGDERLVAGCLLTQTNNQLERSLANSALNGVGCGCLADVETDVGSNAVADRELEMIVRAIRTYRPNIFVCSSTMSSSPSPASASSFLSKCRTALELAGNPNAYPEQIQSMGRSAWRVDRFVVRTQRPGGFTVQAERFLPSAGILLQDQIAIARALIGLNPVYASTEHYRVESFTGSINAVDDDITYGLETLGKELPRRETGQNRGSLGSFATSPLKLEKLKQIVELSRDTAQRNQVENMIRSFGNGQDSREQGIWLWQLADELQRHGRSELAAYALDQLSTRFLNHPLTPAALVWLANHYSSSEVGITASTELKESLADFDPSVQHASKIETSVDDQGVTHLRWEENEDRGTNISLTQYIDKAVDAVRRNRIQTAGAMLNRLKQRDPDLAMSEPIRFMEAKLAEKTPAVNSAENLLKNIRTAGQVTSPFRFASSRELRSGDQAFIQSLPVCFAARTRPLLDGNLDDDIWQNALVEGDARMRVVTPADSDSPTNTDISWLAYDDQFLYLAARCCMQSNHHSEPLQQVRTRDPNLQDYDRIRLELDFDRDLQSTFVFEVDSSGRAAESCAGSSGWNPTWYVACKRDSRAWTIECAIPLDELVEETALPAALIAHRLVRLDRDSIDLWSQEEVRVPDRQQTGIIAGLKIEPRRYEFLRFAEAKPDPQPIDKLP